ncbi:mothers against decapentaplegic homolog 7 isoform X1 [Ceratitis capitata]|uniref:mothers against decapentaplegic homolog 7 isoform X1 n=1 Tax=Ceratitis capitata TaxID=7213 RepID=UPI000329F959|nr:mothers against decapentaplegic homolog 7 isoform X1 [Ceratitis capitata]XP_012156604.1 mothers against decapentaplegic homolog 7 isoform X1 [Ceratitis capitata]XP_012156605.1 mothers against decapentaplegic homolog 7 isoform X1 [Ceratitis capitata]XP_012156606.1 mothers against decapentaplegic homolog 7 isoform X1 [Ceratitis capitata]XP_012156607.1 mothers against decapentaplegic homolog 7 isoform X1 [Ceratitis capitata]XP_020714034.1 mothers against decapentaplegic homolog 7 isoform X1 [C
MLFRKDKELWRYASKNLSRNFDGNSNLESQQSHVPQQQYPIQVSRQYQLTHQCRNSFCHTENTSSTSTSILEYSGSSTEIIYEPKGNVSESGCSCGKNFDDISVVYCDQTHPQRKKHLSCSKDHLAIISQRSLQSNLENQLKSPIEMTDVSTASTTTIGTFAATVNMIRNCCRFSTDGHSNEMFSTAFYQNEKQGASQSATDVKQLQRYQQMFRKLMKMLNRQQQAKLLEAVKSRKEMSVPQDSNCILLKRCLIYKEEPFVIICRLFFWPNLRDGSELKRLPICSNERHSIYVCCNPLHWCRVLETDIASPPYQEMERSFFEEDCAKMLANENTLTKPVRTTDSQDQPSWCQVAYWEFNDRVGNRCCVHKPFVNIYAEGKSCNNDSQDICLRNLAANKSTPSRVDVERTRQKIGLGVVLSQEFEGVWLYNRSMAPVFILSPTLNKCLECVYKVAPGDCLKAFDTNRAQSLVRYTQYPTAKLGPMNMHSICISFVKGWGKHYTRQDIMKCPCWLEISFTQR